MHRKTYIYRKPVILALLSAAAVVAPTRAADYFWSGGTGTYNNPTAWGGAIPAAGDQAFNESGLNNVVQIQPGDPDWTLGDLHAGGQANGAGAYEQNGATVTVGGWMHVGGGANGVGSYTLNSGTLKVLNGMLFLAEAPGASGLLTINGGELFKTGDTFRIGDGAWNGSGALRTATVVQNGGAVHSSSQVFVGQVPGVLSTYTLHGGTLNSSNWFVIGRGGGTGVMNMDGGTLNHVSGGQPAFIVASRDGGDSVGTLNHSGGTINALGSEVWIGQGGGTLGTNNMSGTAILNAGNWLAVGREQGNGVLNLSGGVIHKTGPGNITVGGHSGSVGTVNQTGGSVTNTTSVTYIGESGMGTWNLDGGFTTLGRVEIGRNGSATGTLNVNGGVLTASEITSGNAVAASILNLNGGTIRASAGTPGFIQGLSLAMVGPGGVVFDSQGFDLTIAQPLIDNGSGPVVKTGAGTVRLTGYNTYSGPTLIDAGRLVTTASSGGGGAYAVADNAALGVDTIFANAQVLMAALTLGNGAALDMNLGAYGNPSAAPISVSGALEVNGTVVINLADGLPQIGQFPLIQYGSRSGTGTFVVGSLPVGVVASVVMNDANNSVDLNITSVNLPRWSGLDGGTWDIGLTENWVNIGNLQPTTYGEGNSVLFDDNAQGTTTVDLTTTVNPSRVTFENSGVPYTVTGSGRISGSTSLVKQGTASVTINNTGGNNYTGPTIISNGVLAVTSLANGGAASSIGASSSSPNNLVIGNAALSYAGPAVSTDRGITLVGSNSTVDVQSALTLRGAVATLAGSGLRKTGPGQLTYAGSISNLLAAGANPGLSVAAGQMVFDGSAGGQISRIQQELWVGGTPDAGASLVVTNSTLTVDSWVGLGRGNGSAGHVSRLDLYNSTFRSGNISVGFASDVPGYMATQYMTLSNSVIVNNGAFNLAESGGATATLVLENGSRITNSGTMSFAGSATAALPAPVASVTMNGNSVLANNGNVNGATGNDSRFTFTLNHSAYWTNAGDVNIGRRTGSLMTLNVNDNALVSARNRIVVGPFGSSGVINIANSGRVISAPYFSIGNENGAVGIVNIRDNGELYVGTDFNVSDTGSSTGTLNMQDNALASGHEMYIGKANTSKGTLNLSGGTLRARGNLRVGNNSGSSGNVTVSGGRIAVAGELWAGEAGAAIWNQTAGEVWSTNWLAIGRNGGGSGTFNISGGSVTELDPNDEFIVSENGTGVLNMSGTAQVQSFGAFVVGKGGGGNGTVNLDGGTLTVPRVTGGTSVNRVFRFNGGTLVAGNNANPDFFSGLTEASVLAGGAVIHSGTNVINIGQPLLDGTGGGGLTKLGNGTLRLNGVNSYSGATLVNEGTLGGSGTIAGPVTVASGARLAPGATVGTLTINNTLTLSPGSTTLVEISAGGGIETHDSVSGLTSVTYAGSLVVSNAGPDSLVAGRVYPLFQSAVSGSGNFESVTVLPAGSATFNPATGELTITSAGAPVLNPPTLSGGSMVLTGTGAPGSGYSILTSTNLGLPFSEWATNFSGTIGESGVFTNSIPVNSLEPTRYFRLRQP